MEEKAVGAFSCPLPISEYERVQLAHGGGGRLMRQLLEGLFLPAFGIGRAKASPVSALSRGKPDGLVLPGPAHDSAVVQLADGQRLAFTTDSFVVSPLFFPGGDIGRLAVFGTVNDLAMAGAKPLWLSASFILEEGLPIQTLRQVVASMQEAAQQANVQIITGDTKVVDHGKADGLFITTAGIGLIPPEIEISPARIQPGDVILISGDLGRHGIAIVSVREGLELEGVLPSDCAPLADLVQALWELGPDLHCLRDLTRGGLAAAVNEIALDAHVGIDLDESAIPVSEPVAGACELLGLDPLYVANEGRLVAFVAEESAQRALEILQGHPAASHPARIGRVTAEHPGLVQLCTSFGGSRLLDLPAGQLLPRIC
ncbi:MAG: hydrogenase expression/formation protein HypE [Thermoguttaceae bacterium]|nr:hydrogenase expression/formation protein HypE [Thermoguttaceae bacterium]MDW8036902.1 hydrogenase expression/formation protein HypE [Thermoguttaceae bacterium]